MILTDAVFRQIFPKMEPSVCDPLNRTLADYHIDTRDQCAAFLAQVGHECADLTRLVENLNYSAQGLANTWPGRFRNPDKKPNAMAFELEHKPEAIANHVYASRMGNGNVASGEGWKYRGRGAFMTTGKTNYNDTGRAIGLNLIDNPEQLQAPANALEAAGWFWNRYALNNAIDRGDFRKTTQIINGGQIGADDRQARYLRVLGFLKGAGL